MTRVGLTIFGVPDFRYDLARESRQRYDAAVAKLGPDGDYCSWTLIDKLKQRPPNEFYFDRRKGWVEPEMAFGILIQERIPGTGFLVSPKNKPAYMTDGLFRHELHFGTIVLYQPALQSELDAARVKREERKEIRDRDAERAAAPLFLGSTK